jgi:hypothetical protein
LTALTVDGGGQTIASASAARGGRLSTIVKVSLGVACIVAGAAGVMRTVGDHSARATASQPITPTQATSSKSATVASISSAPREQRSSAPDNRAAPAQLALSETPASAPAGSRLVHLHSTPAKRGRSVSHATARSASALAPAQSRPAQAAGEPEPSAASVPTVAPAPNEASATPSAEPAAPRSMPDPAPDAALADPRAELALAERIHAALRKGKPAAALALCAEHERRWPDGAFAQERDGVRAIASCDLRSKDAASLARAFLANHPHAPLAPRVGAACATQLSAATQNHPAAGSR